ncbi:MAG TPA: Rv3654c family TadE-like protein [Acidimicrobiia bacterium]|nr:Rv3654c family TadE-like protein [Acidimicrobiia bacterium]
MKPIGERGSASILALALVLSVSAIGLAVLAAAQLVTARVRAVNAADAAALAAAPATFPALAVGETPSAVAAEMAEANGAHLLRCLCPVVRSFDPRDVEVEVAVATRIAIVGEVQVRAVSRAEYVP